MFEKTIHIPESSDDITVTEETILIRMIDSFKRQWGMIHTHTHTYIYIQPTCKLNPTKQDD